MKIVPYLNFNGACAEAFAFYAKALGGTIDAMMKYEGTPAEAQAPKDMADRVLHVQLSAGSFQLMGSDVPPGMFSKPQGFAVALTFSSAKEGQPVWDALSQGGTVRMPFQKTFFADAYGEVTDRFGTPWLIYCGV
ncbi:MAG TPA: VOC family protein [bacterium]